MKTIVYGGAFDPPHLAHEHIVRTIAKKYSPERLLIVPSGPRSDKVYKVEEKHRARILSIFAEDLLDIGAELCDDFMTGRIADGTTLGVNRILTERFGHAPTHVFGTDVIPNMKVWDPSGHVERHVSKIFVLRSDGKPQDFSRLDNYRTIAPELPSHLATLSSTGIRENVKKNVLDGLAPKIAEYIADNRLYR